jgi:uncharacterized HhH-GPD family protein
LELDELKLLVGPRPVERFLPLAKRADLPVLDDRSLPRPGQVERLNSTAYPRSMGIAITNNPEADELLNTDPLALLIGMLLDQQVGMEWAFLAPFRLKERLGGTLEAKAIAAMDPDELTEIFRQVPALHRYPGSMAKRTHALCVLLVERYGGDGARVWEEAEDGATLIRRLKELPGYGPEKAKIFAALLGKRLGVQPPGWLEAAAPFSDGTARSVADIDSPKTLAEVRAWKKEMKAKGKTKAD